MCGEGMFWNAHRTCFTIIFPHQSIIRSNRGVVLVIHVVVAKATDQWVHQKVISCRSNAFLPFENNVQHKLSVEKPVEQLPLTYVGLLDCLFCRVARAFFFLLLTKSSALHERGTIWRKCADGQWFAYALFVFIWGWFRKRTGSVNWRRRALTQGWSN